MRNLACALLFAALAGSAYGAPSGSNVLVVYASNVPESVEIATLYAQKRAIPEGNVCAITLPDPTATSLAASEYEDVVRTPVRACLEAAGKRNILYIVLAYVRAFVVDPGSGLRYYALDSYLADIWDDYTKQAFTVPQSPHRYFADHQMQGNFYFPYVPLSEFRKDERTPLIYSVWRLDGSTPEIAKALVENAIYAETHGLTGQACIDALTPPLTFADTGLRAADWDLYRAAQFLRRAGWTVLEDQLETEIGNEPSPSTCPNAALYSGWYSLANYYDAYTWNPGAVGFHLDSASAVDPRGGSNWSANALNRGITVTSGAVAEPYLEALPRPSGVFRNLLEGATVGDAFLRNTRWLKWRIINIGDPLYRPFPDGVAPFNAPFPENSLYVAARQVVAGSVFQGAVTLDQPPPPEGIPVKLLSDNPDAVSVPESVTVPERYYFATFPISIGPVAVPTVVQISADRGGSVTRNTIVAYPVLAQVRGSAAAVNGGQALSGAVFLNRTASADGFTVQLASDQPDIVQVPESVVVPSGTNAAVFPIQTAAVSTEITVKITASLAGAAVSTTLTVKP